MGDVETNAGEEPNNKKKKKKENVWFKLVKNKCIGLKQSVKVLGL